jgi:hypothetical protein
VVDAGWSIRLIAIKPYGRIPAFYAEVQSVLRFSISYYLEGGIFLSSICFCLLSSIYAEVPA